MSEFNAAVGLAQLPHMPDILEQRALDKQYRQRLSEVQGITFLEPLAKKSVIAIFRSSSEKIIVSHTIVQLAPRADFRASLFLSTIPEFEMYQRLSLAEWAFGPMRPMLRDVICLPLTPICTLVKSSGFAI